MRPSAATASPHHGTTKEGDAECLTLTEVVRCSGGTCVRARRGLHPEETRCHGTQGPEDIRDCGRRSDREAQQNRHHHHEHREHCVLAA